jgi:3-methyladenine DNA glycosylase Tag
MDDPLMLQYHDREWGVPVHDDRKHFESLVLEGAQAGLSWSIVLKKREGYRRVFSEFDPQESAWPRMTAAEDPGIPRASKFACYRFLLPILAPFLVQKMGR